MFLGATMTDLIYYSEGGDTVLREYLPMEDLRSVQEVSSSSDFKKALPSINPRKFILEIENETWDPSIFTREINVSRLARKIFVPQL